MTSKEIKKLEKEAKMELWIHKFQECGDIVEANKAVGIGMDTYWHWKRKEPKFQELFKNRHEQLCSILETELLQRALVGQPRKKWHRGVEVGVEYEKSDDLLKVALRAYMPEKYKNHTSVETSGQIKHTHEGSVEHFQNLRIEVLHQLKNDPRGIERIYNPTFLSNVDCGQICYDGNGEQMDSSPSPTTD